MNTDQAIAIVAWHVIDVMGGLACQERERWPEIGEDDWRAVLYQVEKKTSYLNLHAVGAAMKHLSDRADHSV